MTYPASQMTLEALRSVPLFGSLDDDAAKELRSLLREKTVPRNTALFNQGDQGNAMYLIESGRVRISIRDEDEQELTLAELAQGDFFGEMSIIDGRQRSADADLPARAHTVFVAARRLTRSCGRRAGRGCEPSTVTPSPAACAPMPQTAITVSRARAARGATARR